MKSDDSAYTIFNDALEIDDAAARDLYLRQACANDAALSQRVQKLLQAHGEAGQFLSTAATEIVTAPPSATTEKAGDVIGRYKLLEQIGEGGCGVVYMAEQQEPVRRRVALKVIKLGMDTKQVVARFEAERQALAMMDHPNIARVLDAGATSGGRPYFVMELVRGTKITEFCDRKKLSTQGRLELFIRVCQAVQHAHQKGIIHRDLKPSNILVTIIDGAPVPKVIDFGIAKATSNQPLTDKTLFTAFEQFIGTPAYMSPEQAEMSGVDVDTRTDLYSLGVVLYELLTGKTPFDSEQLVRAGIDQIRRTIRDEEPPKPSTRLHTLTRPDLTTTAQARQTDEYKLLHSVAGDLDWIVMKCLEKDRGRRYETVNGLAADIQHHLDNEPVVARPPSQFYRLQKLARRNKLAFGSAAAITVALIIGVVASTLQAIRATRAEREQTRLRARAEANEKKAETEATRSRQVAEFLKDMLRGVGPSVALGRDTTMLREVLDRTAERVGKDLKDQPEVQAELQSMIGTTYWELGEFSKAGAVAREALQTRRKLFGETNELVADSLCDLAIVIHEQHKPAEAETKYREALTIYEKVLSREHPKVAQVLSRMGGTLLMQGKHREAESVFREALAIMRSQSGNEQLAVADVLNEMVSALNGQGKRDEAEAMGREALALCKRVAGDEHPSVATSLLRLGGALGSHGKLAEAESLCREGVAMRKRLLGNDHPYVSSALASLARVLIKQPHRLAEAEAICRESLAIRRKLYGNKHHSVGNALVNLSNVLRQQGKLAEAAAAAREELALERKWSGDEHSNVASSLMNLGEILRVDKKLPEAEAALREALAIHEKTLPDDWQMFKTRSLLGECLTEQKKYVEAEPLLLSSYQGMKQREKKMPLADRPRLKETLQGLVQLYEATAQSEKAAEWKKSLMEFEQSSAGQTSSDPNQRTTAEKKDD